MNHKAPIRNNKLLRESYEAGRRQALNEQGWPWNQKCLPGTACWELQNSGEKYGYVPKWDELTPWWMYTGGGNQGGAQGRSRRGGGQTYQARHKSSPTPTLYGGGGGHGGGGG